MIDSILQRAHQLIELKRYNDAAKELKEALSIEPNRADAIALYAICLAEQDNMDQASILIQQAISQEPDNDYFLYVQALFLLKQDKLKEAEKFIKNAISFEPHNADYFGLLATINLNQKEWKLSLENANKGLELDSNNLTCLNTRSTALFKLDQKDAAYTTIQQALNQDPENEYTHTNIGWGLLEKGDHKLALEHFREALKINPNNETAKAGLVEALKARYLFYRLFLKYAFWLANFKAKGQWAIIIGLYFGIKFLGNLASSNESLAPFLKPIIYLYIIFAVSTWIIAPLSNLFLRLNIYGRYALKDDEIQASNFVGIALCIGLLGGIFYVFNPHFLFLMILIYGISMMIPLASMFNPEKTRSKNILIAYTVALALIGFGVIVQYVLTGDFGIFWTIYLVGVVAYQWVSNAMVIK